MSLKGDRSLGLGTKTWAVVSIHWTLRRAGLDLWGFLCPSEVIIRLDLHPRQFLGPKARTCWELTRKVHSYLAPPDPWPISPSLAKGSNLKSPEDIWRPLTSHALDRNTPSG